MRNLRHIQRQMKMLDMRLQLIRDRLCVARLQRCALPCCCLHHCRHLARKALCARLDLERRLDRIRRLGMMLSSSCCPSPLALIDVKGFDPRDVTVTMKDGKVTVSAERKEECNTCMGRTSSYRKYMKEFCLPPAGCEKEVTYSVKSDSLTEIVAEPKCCTYLCNC
ncbi:hypothetical protein DUI87_07261 [Hirundo rustica rustica]|uniref:Outer dense fiber protein 1 n=2 Tax=Hirundo rustica TaxID=43150 RepID=A0A3M0KR46_HIRRU|nr:hypothetical protein DUI87_07261 [Hirundo rustica rustica]